MLFTGQRLFQLVGLLARIRSALQDLEHNTPKSLLEVRSQEDINRTAIHTSGLWNLPGTSRK